MGAWFNSLATGSVVEQQPLTVPVTENADTMYGTSLDNYGLGPQFMSQRTMAMQARAANASPSLWWLVALLGVVAVFS